VDVTGERPLLVGQVKHIGVAGVQARCRRVGVPGVARQDDVPAEAEQSAVAPNAGVILLIVDDDCRGGGNGIRTAGEVADVGDPALLVYYQILNQVQVLGPGLKEQSGWLVAVGASIVHVYVEVRTVPAGSWQVRQSL
jgi:hypothetical protein